MWEISLSNQITTFLLSIAVGACFCLLYDICRFMQIRRRLSTAWVFLSDVLYFIVIGVFEFCFFLSTCSGEVRGFVYVGNAVGFAICRVTVSKLFAVALKFVFKLFDRIKLLIRRLIYEPFLKTLKKAKIFVKTLKKTGIFRKKVLKNDV